MWESIWPWHSTSTSCTVAGTGLRARDWKPASACRGRKMCCVSREWIRGKTRQFLNIYWLNPAQSLHGAQLPAIKVESQCRSTAKPFREKCSRMASTDAVIKVCVPKHRSLGSLRCFWGCELGLCHCTTAVRPQGTICGKEGWSVSLHLQLA